jgi:hypothetical protein
MSGYRKSYPSISETFSYMTFDLHFKVKLRLYYFALKRLIVYVREVAIKLIFIINFMKVNNEF